MPKGHREIYKKAVNLMTSKQMEGPFKVAEGVSGDQGRLGTGGFGPGPLMARRLVETGVPFVEGGWVAGTFHNNVFKR
ncbi:MAG: hypothetical protein CM1200mP2_00930 [Planctomycetaceae bacterium]|nr:MAG: hypothetical protein CM1200mP2_00930 [Planctomycetaceae bacterium]